MYEDLLKEIGAEVSARLAFEELKALHEMDRWFTFPAFHRSAAYAASRWQEFGLSGAKVDEYPADGRTPVGSWVMPYAWDARDATLVVEEPAELAGTVLASYREIPCSLAMWSGPTPRDGVVADVEVVDDADDPTAWKGRDLKGRIAFVSVRGVFAKGHAARHGAIGVLSDFVTHAMDKPDEVFWTNAWSDDTNGWALIERDSRIFGFNISPRRGAWLRDQLRQCGRVRVRAVVDTKLYRGTLPTATAVIPGESRSQEVLVLGHAFEQGANDNASGCAVMLEAARALNKLISEGALRRPRRTIRFLIVSECYSTFAYCERYAERMKRTAAGICVDSVAHRQDVCRAALGLARPAEANASFVTAFSERLAGAVFGAWRTRYKWLSMPYITTDNVVTDPMIGPPTILLTAEPGDLFWHSTGDTPDKVDVDALGKICEFTAAYLYAIASADALDALYFAALATARAKGQLSLTMAESIDACRDGKGDLASAKGRLLYAAKRGAREVESVRSLLKPKEVRSIQVELATMMGEIIADGRRDAEQIERLLNQCGGHRAAPEPSPQEAKARERAAAVVPVRKYIGTMSFDFIAPRDRQGLDDPRWHGGVTAALFWCDGRRTLDEALSLAGNELGRNLFGLVPVFDFMAKYGLIELGRA